VLLFWSKSSSVRVVERDHFRDSYSDNPVALTMVAAVGTAPNGYAIMVAGIWARSWNSSRIGTSAYNRLSYLETRQLRDPMFKDSRNTNSEH
jgi:hypothetical protein